jgi:hypothetical protein
VHTGHAGDAHRQEHVALRSALNAVERILIRRERPQKAGVGTRRQDITDPPDRLPGYRADWRWPRNQRTQRGGLERFAQEHLLSNGCRPQRTEDSLFGEGDRQPVCGKRCGYHGQAEAFEPQVREQDQ